MSRGTRQRWPFLLLVAVVFASAWWVREGTVARGPWTDAELDLLRSLWLQTLPPLPPDPSNAAGDSQAAAQLGHLLFFDKSLSANGAVACATCHQPQLRFTDGLPTAQALGTSARNTASLVGVSYSPWFYWDGRKDSQWAQALSPLEDPAEHGSNRQRLARQLLEQPVYRALYAEIYGAAPDLADPMRFPADAGPLANAPWRRAWDGMREEDRQLVDQVFANMGKALAAYQRKLLPGPGRFDAYVAGLLQHDADAERLFTADERAGLRLFIGKGRCIECHNGPLFTNNEFHNTGVLPPAGAVPDQGRSRALAQLRADPFNCVGVYSDATPGQCVEFNFMRSGAELVGAMRTPSLRNLGGTAPYMHKGQLPTLRAVLDHYNAAPQALIGHNEAEPLGLGKRELRQLEAFLLTLDAPPATAAQWLAAPPAQ